MFRFKISYRGTAYIVHYVHLKVTRHVSEAVKLKGGTGSKTLILPIFKCYGVRSISVMRGVTNLKKEKKKKEEKKKKKNPTKTLYFLSGSLEGEKA